MTEPKEITTPLPENIINQAYQGGRDAITLVAGIPENFNPVIRMVEATATGEEKNIWKTSTELAWALRVADSQGNSDLVDSIKKSLSDKPKMEFYVTYQLLSDSYENEKEFEDQGIGIKPVSPELHKFLFDVVKNGLTATSDPSELSMFQNISARAAEFAKEVGYGSTYLGVNEVLDLAKILDTRKLQGDIFLNGTEGTKLMDQITLSTNHLQRIVLQ